MPAKFDIKHAQNFLDFYATDEKLRYGVHLYLFRMLIKYDLVYENIDSYIDAGQAHTLDPLPFFLTHTDQNETNINVNQMSIDKYVSALCPAYAQEHPILSGQNTNPLAYQTFTEAIHSLSCHSEKYRSVGRSLAFMDAANIDTGQDDWEYFYLQYDKYKRQMRNKMFSGQEDEIEDEDLLYEMDRIDQHIASKKTFPNWPINKIGGMPLYACKGYRKNNKEGFGFFTELLNFDQHNKESIFHVVALGFPEGHSDLNDSNFYDFSDYFKMTTAYDVNVPDAKADDPSKTKTITIQVNPNGASEPTIISDNIDEYYLTLSAIDKSDNSIITKQDIHVINVKAKDMTAIKFTPEESRYFHDELLKALKANEGVLVHCMAGLGRTGQIIAELYTLANDIIQKIIEKAFNAGEPVNYAKIATEIGRIINSLRESRPGLILTEEQLLQFIENAITYLALQADCELIESQEALAANSNDNNNDNKQKKRKHEDNINPEKTDNFKLFKPKPDEESTNPPTVAPSFPAAPAASTPQKSTPWPG